MDYLKETEYFDFKNAKIQNVLQNELKISQVSSDKEKAIIIHDFVRDQVRFGFTRSFYDMKASEVVDSRVGFCNNKSTLFVAMLRAVGIKARIVFVDIDKHILDGIVDPRTPYVDHSYSEVFLNDKWIKVDSYIVDTRLFKAAMAKLKESNRKIGWGIHENGSNEWNGEDDSFSQYVIKDAKNISTKTHGTYEDVGDFYAKAQNTWNKKNLIQNCVFLLFASRICNEIEKLRNS